MSSDSKFRYFEDFPDDEVISFGAYEVTEQEITSFALQYDPLPFHVDVAAAKKSVIGELIASGWHVLSMQMRMIYDGFLHNSASMGSFGLEDVQWKAPVRPGDVLSCRRTTLSRRVSKKRPEMGIIVFRWEIFNQHDELKMLTEGANLFETRASQRSA